MGFLPLALNSLRRAAPAIEEVGTALGTAVERGSSWLHANAPEMVEPFQRTVAARHVTPDEFLGHQQAITDLAGTPENGKLLERYLHQQSVDRALRDGYGLTPDDLQQISATGVVPHGVDKKAIRNWQASRLAPEEHARVQNDPQLQAALSRVYEAGSVINARRKPLTAGIQGSTPDNEFVRLGPVAYWRQLVDRLNSGKHISIYDHDYFLRQALEEGATQDELAQLQTAMGFPRILDRADLYAAYKVPEVFPSERTVAGRRLAMMFSNPHSTAQMLAHGNAPAYDLSLEGTLGRDWTKDSEAAALREMIDIGRKSGVLAPVGGQDPAPLSHWSQLIAPRARYEVDPGDYDTYFRQALEEGASEQDLKKLQWSLGFKKTYARDQLYSAYGMAPVDANDASVKQLAQTRRDAVIAATPPKRSGFGAPQTMVDKYGKPTRVDFSLGGLSDIARQHIEFLTRDNPDMADGEKMAVGMERLLAEIRGLETDMSTLESGTMTDDVERIVRQRLNIPENEAITPEHIDLARRRTFKDLSNAEYVKSHLVEAREGYWAPEQLAALIHETRTRQMTPNKYHLGALTDISRKATGINLSYNAPELISHLPRNAEALMRTPQGRTPEERVLEMAVPKIGRVALMVRNLMRDPHTQEYAAMEHKLRQAGELVTHFQEVQGGLGSTKIGRVLNAPRDFVFTKLIPRMKVVYALSLKHALPDLTDAELLRAMGGFGVHLPELQGNLTRAAVGSGTLPFGGFESGSIPAAFRHYLTGDVGPGRALNRNVGLRIENVAHNALAIMALGSIGTYLSVGKWPHEVGLRPWEIGFHDNNGDVKGVNLFAIMPQAERVMRTMGVEGIARGDAPEKAGLGMANLALGIAGTNPVLRGLSTALTGRAPYLTQGGDLYQVLDNKKINFGQRLLRGVAGINPLVESVVSMAVPTLIGEDPEKRFELAKNDLLGMTKDAGQGVGPLASAGFPGLRLIRGNEWYNNNRPGSRHPGRKKKFSLEDYAPSLGSSEEIW